MGACEYENIVHGFGTAREAFDYITKEARYQHGHGGYTGTIAEKSSFRMVHVPDGEDPFRYAEKLINGDDMRYQDKCGPANCIEFFDEKGRKAFIFFGIASS